MTCNPFSVRDVDLVPVKTEFGGVFYRVEVYPGIEGEQLCRESTVAAIRSLVEVREWVEIFLDSKEGDSARAYAMENLRRVLGPHPKPETLERSDEDPEKFDEATGPFA